MSNQTTIEALKSLILKLEQPTAQTVTKEQLQELLAERSERPFDASEACEYLKVKLATLYSYTHKKLIACYRPTGRKLYFMKSDLDDFLLGKRSKSNDELEQQAANFVLEGGVR